MNFPRPIPLALHPALGRGGGGGGGRGSFGGFGGGTRGAFRSPEGIPSRRSIQSGFCGPEEAMGTDGYCHPIIGIGQAAAPSSSSKPVAVTAVLVGLGAGAAQLLTGDGSMLNKLAFWTEIAALTVLAGVVIGMPANQ